MTTQMNSRDRWKVSMSYILGADESTVAGDA